MNKNIVWITGASQGIGRALAWAMAQQGMQVIASARSRENLDKLVEESEQLPGDIEALPLDVTVSQATNQAVEQIIENHG
ncbi:MAG: SDR family NAD(P)-dependent oxidoreductase, partial [Bacteroidales bacterium]|nr:SDR family NAD(P)-dependent oxidoreductase [Bacteroidales bacterium]